MTSEQDSRGFGALAPKPGPPPAPKPGPPPAATPTTAPTAPGPVGASPAGAGPAAATSAGAGSGGAEAQVAAVLAALDDLDSRPVSEHVAAYETVHRTLQDTLSAVDGS